MIRSFKVFGLKSRLSQAWLAAPLLGLIIFILKLILLKQFLQTSLRLARTILASECAGLSALTKHAEGIPKKTVQLANRLISGAIDVQIRSLISMLRIVTSIIESLILLAIDLTVGSYACLTISAVNIGANAAINATEVIVTQANKSAKAIGRELNSGLNVFSKFINGAIGLINSVDDFITGGERAIKDINMTVAKLDNLEIPTQINTRLDSLRNDIPTYEGTKAAVKAIVKEPFHLLRTQLNNISIKTNVSFIPSARHLSLDIPQCHREDIDKIINGISTRISKVTTILCILCGLAIILGMAFNLWRENSRWKRVEALASETLAERNANTKEIIERNAAAISNNASDSWIERWIYAHTNPLYHWPMRYCTTSVMMTPLYLGLAGLAISLMELIVAKAFSTGIRELYQLEQKALGNIADAVKPGLASWVEGINSNMASTENDVNTNLLGWVHEGSKGINNTISTFVSTVNGEIGSVFNGTVLLRPLQAVSYCLFENKARAMEQGLTWLYNHTHVNLPRVEKRLIQSYASEEESSLKAISGSIQAQASVVIASVQSQVMHQIHVQIIASVIFIAAWILVVILTLLFYKYQSSRVDNDAPAELEVEEFEEKFTRGIKRGRRPASIRTVRSTNSTIVGMATHTERQNEPATAHFQGPTQQFPVQVRLSPIRASFVRMSPA